MARNTSNGKPKNLRIEDARIIFKNFSGRASQYNNEGNRNFNVIIDDVADVEAMAAEGWKIRELPPREEGDSSTYILKVVINFNSYTPPVFHRISGKHHTILDEDSVGILDSEVVESVDIQLNPYPDRNNPGKFTAYLTGDMYAVVQEDPFAHKYRYDDDIPFE